MRAMTFDESVIRQIVSGLRRENARWRVRTREAEAERDRLAAELAHTLPGVGAGHAPREPYPGTPRGATPAPPTAVCLEPPGVGGTSRGQS